MKGAWITLASLTAITIGVCIVINSWDNRLTSWVAGPFGVLLALCGAGVLVSVLCGKFDD